MFEGFLKDLVSLGTTMLFEPLIISEHSAHNFSQALLLLDYAHRLSYKCLKTLKLLNLD